MINVLKFYRIKKYKQKIAWTRCLAYVFIAYAVSETCDGFLMLGNLLVISVIFMTTFSLNDFYDHKTCKEENYIGDLLSSKKYSKKYIIFLIFLPLVFCLTLIYQNPTSAILSLLFLFIGLAYSLPKVRLKDRFGYLYSPLCAGLIFLGSFFVCGNYNVSVFVITILLVLFHVFTETIHILEEFQMKERMGEKTKKTAFNIFKIIPVVSLLVSVAAVFINITFVIGIVFSLVRIINTKKINLDYNFYSLHRNTFSKVYSPFEFLFYALFGILGVYA